MKKFIFILLISVLCIGSFFIFKQKNPPLISVVMSTYNRAPLLSRAIDSILNQTFTDFEFIIIDDGSSDKTPEILAEYAKKDKRIRVITNNPNKGLIYSLNKGLEEAKGKYIARMDDDDISLPNRFMKQYDFMEKNPDIAVAGSWIGNPDNNQKWGFHDQTDPEKIKMFLYLNSVPISHPAAFIRRSFLTQHNITYSNEYKAAEDRKFWLDIMDADGKITNIPEVLLLFRLHGTNPYEYYVNQISNAHKFFHNEILPRFASKEEFENLDNCSIMRKMVEKNENLNLIPHALLKTHVMKICPPENAEKVNHPQWEGHFVFENERVCRHDSKDCATIIEKTSDKMTIKWDDWGTETFEKKDNIWTIKK
ncbi:MAG: glycosyltransferase family 2 protein [Alphaproteobacteria bacterium]|nr:glycosyltransferase family 2 protein [Alphaproteobacteria bacterium]